MPDTASAPASSLVARFPTEARVAHAVIEQLADRFDSTDAVVTAFEDASGRWMIAIHFRDRPNETLARDPALLSPAARPFANYPGGHAEGFPDSFKQLFRAVYDAVASGGHQSPESDRVYPTFADGHREALVCEAILRSHREQRWVSVPPA